MQEKQEKRLDDQLDDSFSGEPHELGTTSERNLNTEEIMRRRRKDDELTWEEVQAARSDIDVNTYPGQAGFGWALDEIKNGLKMRRLNWEHNEFVFLVPGSTFQVNRAPLLGIYEEGTTINYQEHIDKCQSNGNISTWNPNNEELLAMDWVRA